MNVGVLIGLISVLFAQWAFGDVLILKRGYVIVGSVVEKEDDAIHFQTSAGTNRYPRSIISEVHEKPVSEGVESIGPANRVSPIPSWTETILCLSTQTWAYEIRQIPLTLIDKGALKHVPYRSFRFGVDYELNVYGDPAAPACVEVGMYRSLLKNDLAKSNCLDFIASLLRDSWLRRVLAGMDRKGTLVTQGGLTFEITPPSGEDSYGGWWVSVYSEDRLNRSRASSQELGQITAMPQRAAAAPTEKTDDSWSTSELTQSRNSARSSYSTPRSHGPVYVRSYTRKDGTYVRAHTRAR